MKLNNILLFLLLIITYFGCKSAAAVKTDLQSDIQGEVHPEYQTDDQPYLLAASLFVDKSKSIPDHTGFYKVFYEISFSFKGAASAGYKITDSSGNILDEVKNMAVGKKQSEITSKFSDYFLYESFNYYVELIDKYGEIFISEGIVINHDSPEIDSTVFGPVLSEVYETGRKISLFIESNVLLNNNSIEFARLIPPSENFFWEMTVNSSSLSDSGNVTVGGKVFFSDHMNYLENGIYIFQISFGKSGIIQKEFELSDIYNNKKGPNYGFMIPEERSNTRNQIELSINDIDLAESIEIVMYSMSDKQMRRLGKMRTALVSEVISKSDLFSSIRTSEGDRVKLSYNREYYYQVVLISREINGVKYLATSNPMKIVFHGFNFLNF